MIPFIRSLSELMAITKSRETQQYLTRDKGIHGSTMDSGKRKRYIKSLTKKEIDLPDLPKTLRRKWMQNKVSVSKFIDKLDYNNQIQSSYDLTLLERQNRSNQKDVA